MLPVWWYWLRLLEALLAPNYVAVTRDYPTSSYQKISTCQVGHSLSIQPHDVGHVWGKYLKKKSKNIAPVNCKIQM